MEESGSGREFESSTINSRSSSSIQTEAVAEFSILIEKLHPILSEMKDSMEITEVPALEKAMASLESDYKRARAAMDSQQILQSSPAKHIECLVQNLGRSLGLTLFASHDSPLSNKTKIEELCKEMMNVRFDLSSDRDWNEDEDEDVDVDVDVDVDEEETETETEFETEEETEIVEEETTVTTVDDAILQIKYGREEGFSNSLLMLDGFIKDGAISNETISEEDVVRILCSRLSSCKGNERLIILRIMRYLAQQDEEHKVLTFDEMPNDRSISIDKGRLLWVIA